MPHRPKRSLILVLALFGLVAVALFAADAWNRWPERTRARFFALVAKGDFGAANRLIEPPCEFIWFVDPPLSGAGDDGTVALFDGADSVDLSASMWRASGSDQTFGARPRTLEDRIVGRLVVEGELISQIHMLLDGVPLIRAGVFTTIPTRVTITFLRDRVSIALEPLQQFQQPINHW